MVTVIVTQVEEGLAQSYGLYQQETCGTLSWGACLQQVPDLDSPSASTFIGTTRQQVLRSMLVAFPMAFGSPGGRRRSAGASEDIGVYSQASRGTGE